MNYTKKLAMWNVHILGNLAYSLSATSTAKASDSIFQLVNSYNYLLELMIVRGCQTNVMIAAVAPSGQYNSLLSECLIRFVKRPPTSISDSFAVLNSIHVQPFK